MKALALCLGILAASLSFGQSLFGNDTNAFVLMPAEAISSSLAFDYSVTFSGKQVLYRRKPAPTLEKLFDKDNYVGGDWYTYNRQSKTSKRLNFPGNVSFLAPLGDDANIFFSQEGPQPRQGFLNINTGGVTYIDTKGISTFLYYGELPFAPFMVGRSENNDMVFFFPNGNVSSIKVDPQLFVAFPIGGDTNNLYFIGKRRDLPKTPSFLVTLNKSSMTLASRAFAPNEKDILMDKLQPGRHFGAVQMGDMTYIELFPYRDMDASVPVSITAKLTPQVKEKQKPTNKIIKARTAIGPGGARVEFSPQNDFVIYQDAGALLLREIKPIDALLAQRLASEDLRTKLLNQVKQVGTAFLIYGADNDDVLPGAEGWENKVLPYTKDRDMLKDFNYTYRGGDLSGVENPATTEMGFVLGPGGRAVVYLDGHAKWIDNP